jgi:hypothetical protein
MLSPEGITTDSEKLKFVQEWPTTKNKYEIRSFLDSARITDCRDQDLKKQLRLRKERAFGRIFRKTIGLGIMKRTVGSSVRI